MVDFMVNFILDLLVIEVPSSQNNEGEMCKQQE